MISMAASLNARPPVEQRFVCSENLWTAVLLQQ